MAYDAGKGISGALSGAATGATIGSVVPGIGTAIGAGVGLLAGGAMGFFGGKDENGVEIPTLNLPDYYLNDRFSPTLNYIGDYSQNLTQGIIPDYFKSITETGSPQFESLLGQTKRDINTAVDEELVRSGLGRGAVGAVAKAKSIADITGKLRYDDFLKANQGKQFMLQTGLAGLEGTRNAALSESGMQNEFNLGRSNLELKDLMFRYEAQKAAESEDNAMWQNLTKMGTSMLMQNSGGLGGLSGMFGGGSSGGSAISSSDLISMFPEFGSSLGGSNFNLMTA